MAKRTYVSPSRAAQAAATRERILDATIEILGDDLASLTVPAVAKRSGLSVPTIYRYFADKEALVDAAADHVRESLGVPGGEALPSSLTEYLEMQRRIFRQLSEADARTVGAVVATFGRGAGAMDLEERRRWLDPVFDGRVDDWDDADRRNLVSVLAVLWSSVGATALRQFGVRGDDAADLVEWLVTRLVDGRPDETEEG